MCSCRSTAASTRIYKIPGDSAPLYPSHPFTTATATALAVSTIKEKNKRERERESQVRALRYGPLSVSFLSSFSLCPSIPKTKTKTKTSLCFVVKSQPSDPSNFPQALNPNNGSSVTSELTDLELRTPTRIMELNDSTSDELRDARPAAAEPTRSVLGIDLNEIPSPPETLPDSYDVVRSYHDHPSPPPGGPAGVPGSARGSACPFCGKPEVRGHVVVCDGCERGFHLTCAGMRGRQAVNLEEWVCEECTGTGVRSKRWPLGVKSKQILDINASPPSDVDDIEELRDLR